MFKRQLWIILWLVTVVMWPSECARDRGVAVTSKMTVTKKERPNKLTQVSTRNHYPRRTTYLSTVAPVTRKFNLLSFTIYKKASKVVIESTRSASVATSKTPRLTATTTSRLHILRKIRLPPKAKLRSISTLAKRKTLVTTTISSSNEDVSDTETANLPILNLQPRLKAAKIPRFTRVQDRARARHFESDTLSFRSGLRSNKLPPIKENSTVVKENSTVDKKNSTEKVDKVIKTNQKNKTYFGLVKQHRTTYICPRMKAKFDIMCRPPRGYDFYPKTTPIDQPCTTLKPLSPKPKNESDIGYYAADVHKNLPEIKKVNCTPPTVTPKAETARGYRCPTTTRPIAHDRMCLYSCTFPPTTGCCTDPTTTATKTTTESDCCTEPTNTPCAPVVYEETCYELTQITTTKPCICFKVLEFTMTKDDCQPSCTEPTSTCPPPPSTSLTSTDCHRKTTLCISLTPRASTHRTEPPPLVPCGCLTSSVEQTTCRKSVSTETPCVVVVPTTCTILRSEAAPSTCSTNPAPTTTCIRVYVRNADEDKIVEADYAKMDVNNSRRDPGFRNSDLPIRLNYIAA